MRIFASILVVFVVGLFASVPGGDKSPCKCDPVCKCSKDKNCGCGKCCLEPQIGDISGFYEVSGTEASGKKYTGICTIEKKGEVYLIQWAIGGGSMSGVGIRTNNNLAVGWMMQVQGAVSRGVNLYTISNKKLTGRWACIPGPGTMASENLSWLKELADE